MSGPRLIRPPSHASADDFRRIADLHPDGTVVVDSAGTVVYANAAGAKMLARELSELVGSRLGVSVGRVQPIKLEVERGPGRAGEVELVWRTCSWRGEPGQLFTIRDVTQARRAAAALKRSQVRFRTLMEHLPDGVALHRRGRVFYVNPALATMLGYAADLSDFGRFLLDHVPAEDRDTARKALGIDEGAQPIAGPVELRLLQRGGEASPVEARSIPVKHDSVESTLTIVQDIRERNAVVARMMQLDRLAAMGTLAAGIGHEINNPMTFVHGNLELAMEALDELSVGDRVGDEVLEELRVAIGTALQGASRVTEIVSDFRTFTRQETTESRAVDVVETVRFAVKMAAHHTRHRARVELDLPPVRKASADPTRLGQVFLNLLVNAAQAICEGHVADNVITVRARDDGDAVLVEVSDTGMGIEPDKLKQIFEPFYTTKGAGEGMGLGLAIAMETVMAHGGRLEVRSEVGQGTTFSVRLPVAAIPAPAPMPADDEPGVPTFLTSGGRVLVIDDEPRVGEVVRSALAPRYEVDATDDPVSALERLLGPSPRYDLVLCDLLMPSLSGMDLYDTVQRARPELLERIVFITAGGSTPASQAFLTEHAERVLFKPLVIGELRRFVTRHIGSGAEGKAKAKAQR